MKKSVLDVFFERNGIDKEAFLQETARDRGVVLRSRPSLVTRSNARVLLEATAVLASQPSTERLAGETARACGQESRKTGGRLEAHGGADGGGYVVRALGYETYEQLAEAFRDSAA